MKKKSAVSGLPTARKSDFLYRGESMRMVFRDGDGILIEECDFPELCSGDIVCFTLGKIRAVHRLVDAASGLTGGDNNIVYDSEKLTPETFIGRVSAFRRGEKIFPVTRGRRGMREYRLHQFRLRLRLTGRRILAPLRLVTGYIAGMICRPKLEKYGDREVLYWCGRVLASRSGNGKINIRGGWARLFPGAQIRKYFEKKGNN